MLDRLTPEIIRLQQIRDPITVYIDSRGGSVLHADALLRLLTAPSQDSATPCSIITVVTARASSAAADLLSSGHYALAYPHSIIHYHGVRTPTDEALTVEVASLMAKRLKLSNDYYAMSLARASNRRFFYRYVSLMGDFDGYRTTEGNPNLSGFDAFVGVLKQRLSPLGKDVLKLARTRTKRYEDLSDKLFKHKGFRAAIRRPLTDKHRFAKVEAEVLKGIISFELATNKKDGWTFSGGGMAPTCRRFHSAERVHRPP
jgi:hypothetical protein